MASVATWWPHQSGLSTTSSSHSTTSLPISNEIIPPVNYPSSWSSTSGWLTPTDLNQTQILNNNWTNSPSSAPSYANCQSWGSSGYPYLSQGWLNQQTYSCGWLNNY